MGFVSSNVVGQKPHHSDLLRPFVNTVVMATSNWGICLAFVVTRDMEQVCVFKLHIIIIKGLKLLIEFYFHRNLKKNIYRWIHPCSVDGNETQTHQPSLSAGLLPLFWKKPIQTVTHPTKLLTQLL